MRGPRLVPKTALNIELKPIAFPISFPDVMSPIKARAVGIINDVPIPWMLLDTRKTEMFGEIALSNKPKDEMKSP